MLKLTNKQSDNDNEQWGTVSSLACYKLSW